MARRQRVEGAAEEGRTLSGVSCGGSDQSGALRDGAKSQRQKPEQ